MFGYTAEDDKNWLGYLFDFCGRQILTLEACSTEYDHQLIMNTLVQKAWNSKIVCRHPLSIFQCIYCKLCSDGDHNMYSMRGKLCLI